MVEGFELEYGTSINMLQHEGQLVWTRYSLFLAAHSLLIAAVVQLYIRTTEESSRLEIVHLSEWFCMLGMALCVLWSIATFHGLSKCSQWITRIRVLERTHGGLPQTWSSEADTPAGKRHLFLHLAAILAIVCFLTVYFLTWKTASECSMSVRALVVCSSLIALFCWVYYRDSVEAKSDGGLLNPKMFTTKTVLAFCMLKTSGESDRKGGN